MFSPVQDPPNPRRAAQLVEFYGACEKAVIGMSEENARKFVLLRVPQTTFDVQDGAGRERAALNDPLSFQVTLVLEDGKVAEFYRFGEPPSPRFYRAPDGTLVSKEARLLVETQNA